MKALLVDRFNNPLDEVDRVSVVREICMIKQLLYCMVHNMEKIMNFGTV